MSTQNVTSGPSILSAPSIDWAGRMKMQAEQIRTGRYRRIGRLDALCFELTKLSNPNMLALGMQKTATGRQAWPGKNLDWLNHGPPIAWAVDCDDLLLPARPLPLPPDCPDPEFVWRKEGDMPGLIPQRLEDRAVAIKGTPYVTIQPVTQIHWVLDLAMPGHPRREIHNVRSDYRGLSMAFVYDPQTQTGYLIGGEVIP